MARDTNKRAAEAALVISQMVNQIAILAAPKVAQKLPALPSRLAFIEVIDAYLRGLTTFGETTRSSRSVLRQTTEPRAKHLRALLADWTPSRDVPPAIQHAARALIEAFGFPSPPKAGRASRELAPEPSDQRQRKDANQERAAESRRSLWRELQLPCFGAVRASLPQTARRARSPALARRARPGSPRLHRAASGAASREPRFADAQLPARSASRPPALRPIGGVGARAGSAGDHARSPRGDGDHVPRPA